MSDKLLYYITLNGEKLKPHTSYERMWFMLTIFHCTAGGYFKRRVEMWDTLGNRHF